MIPDPLILPSWRSESPVSYFLAE